MISRWCFLIPSSRSVNPAHHFRSLSVWFILKFPSILKVYRTKLDCQIKMARPKERRTTGECRGDRYTPQSRQCQNYNPRIDKSIQPTQCSIRPSLFVFVFFPVLACCAYCYELFISSCVCTNLNSTTAAIASWRSSSIKFFL